MFIGWGLPDVYNRYLSIASNVTYVRRLFTENVCNAMINEGLIVYVSKYQISSGQKSIVSLQNLRESFYRLKPG